jgi:anti-sigma-K factor RskA
VTPPISAEERDQLAAELALGVLEGDELVRAQALFSQDAEFRSAVAEWLGRLSPLLDEVEPVQPPDSVWLALERQLGVPPAANDNLQRLRRRLSLWRGVAAGASALAASMAFILVTRPPQVAPPVTVTAPAPMIAMLGDEQKGALLVASWNPGQNSLRMSAAAEIPADPAHSHELWVIPADGTPRSLGTMPTIAKMQMPIAANMVQELREGATLAVSVEPLGGSPTGLPTGPVVASGKLERA